MTRDLRMRWLTPALALLLAVGLSACNTFTPNSIFGAHSEFGHAVDLLTRRLLYLGILVFILVESLLVFILVKFRDKDGNREAKQIHGNTTLEVGWTLVPAVILAFIAVPTIKTIFETQAKAVPNALQVEVIGHQWWWEFRYPQYGVVTANELYLPVGRTANFALTTKDVLHSFWIPQLNGKRDLISNHTNYIWFTPDSAFAWNGFCAEYCGTSHANMRFKVFTVTPAEFDGWIAHQKTNAVGSTPPAPAIAADSSKPAGGPAVSATVASKGTTTPGNAKAPPPPVVTPVMNVADTATNTFPRARLPEWVKPKTPTPAALTFDPSVQGDAARGAAMFRAAPCIACHTVRGVPTAAGIVGPNLTHVGSRTTIAGGLYPNDLEHLQKWIKNAPAMKPGSLMPLFGKAEKGDTPGVYTDQQIADLAAYLSSLK
ncbi:MAG: cytochrome c oxidase subunit II [Gemmatimonadaceae bacterium]|nr:cytochrome c oxidase subunit II [Gemmatimonadaceae bacterium]